MNCLTTELHTTMQVTTSLHNLLHNCISMLDTTPQLHFQARPGQATTHVVSFIFLARKIENPGVVFSHARDIKDDGHFIACPCIYYCWLVFPSNSLTSLPIFCLQYKICIQLNSFHLQGTRIQNKLGLTRFCSNLVYTPDSTSHQLHIHRDCTGNACHGNNYMQSHGWSHHSLNT